MPTTLSLPEARRLAIASQGFGKRPASPSLDHVRKLAAKVHAFQIDSVNVLARAHYVPAFARLGPYRGRHDRRARLSETRAVRVLGPRRVPLARRALSAPALSHAHRRDARLHGLGPGRRPRAGLRGGGRAWANCGWRAVRSRERARGNGGAGATGSFGSKPCTTRDSLPSPGVVASSALYDLAERVIPRAVLDAPTPPREDAMKQLICLAAKAYGVGTFGDIVGYFMTDAWHDRGQRWPWWAHHGEKGRGSRTKPIAKRLVSELVEEGRLLPARVDGWTEPAYLSPNARIPTSVDARALVTPFDSLVWERDRIDRLFGMKYTIEIYLPRSQTRLRLLRLPVPARRHARCALRSQGRSRATRAHGAKRTSRAGPHRQARGAGVGRRAASGSGLARARPDRSLGSRRSRRRPAACGRSTGPPTMNTLDNE